MSAKSSASPRWKTYVEAKLADSCFFVEFRQRQRRTAYHYQPGVEIHLTNAGQSLIRVGQVEVPQTVRNVLVYRVSIPHQLVAGEKEEHLRTVTCLDNRVLAGIRGSDGEPLFNFTWISNTSFHNLRLGPTAWQEMESACETIAAESPVRATGWRRLALANVAQLLVRLQRRVETLRTTGVLEPATAGNAEKLVQHVREYVDRSLADDLTLDKVAGTFRVSAEHLRRSFHLEVGVPFHRYVLLCRIKHAKSLIDERPDLAMTRLAMEVGFESLSGFSRAFKRITGESPSQYRARPHTHPEA